MEGDREELKTFIVQELGRLGIKNEPVKKNQSAKKSKSKSRISPARKTNSPSHKSNIGKQKTPKAKSPFKSNKRKAELRQIALEENKKGHVSSGQVFGRALSEVPVVCVYMNDGIQVTVPEFLVDICNLIRSNISTEGIFRKAGSSQRQNEIKKLIDGGNPLPNTVHVIDAACLLKKFLHCMPEPLLTNEVYTLFERCLKLNKDLQMDAFILCTLLLPLPKRETLAYLMEFLGDVAAASGMNLMDSHNLAIVLAPNLFTFTPPTTSLKSNHLSASIQPAYNDLTTNIDVIKAMIKNCAVICRIPNHVASEMKERSQSQENLLTIEHCPSGSARKKRRSASIHRVMTGLRRFVGQSSGSGGFSPMLSTGSADNLDQLHSYPGCTLSPLPQLHEEKKGKRKSADAFDLCVMPNRERFQRDCYFNDSVPASKRAKVDIIIHETTKSDSHLVPSEDAVISPLKRTQSKVGRSHTVRNLKGSQEVLTQPRGHYFLGNAKTTIKRSKSTFVSGTSAKTFETQVFQSSILPLNNKACETPPLLPLRSTSMHPLTAHPSMTTPYRPLSVRRSLDSAVRKIEASPRRHSSIKRRMSGNEPDGATIGPSICQRGEPDGAECNLRDLPSLPIPNKPLMHSLEEQYDEIKNVVKNMEEEVDKNNIQQLKDTFLSDNSTSSVQNISCSEMIQNAYERMKEESKDLENSPTVLLSKRLGKELHVHKRRSSEHRVMRSPSERKIGTIRRRSRELAQNAAKSLVNVEDTPKPLITPKMKGTLMQTPLRLRAAALQTPMNSSLKRGRPNSLKVGLPVIVRNINSSSEKKGSPVCIDDAANKTVKVNKRLEDTFNCTPTPSPNRSRRRSLQAGRRLSESFKRKSLDKSVDDFNLTGVSILHQLQEPLNHNRLANFISPKKDVFSIHNLQSNDNSFNNNVHDEKCLANVFPNSHTNNMDIFSNEYNDQAVERESAIQQMSSNIGTEMEVNEEWVSGEQYLNDMDTNDLCQLNVEGGRPSIVALKRQKKVTSNVHLFNSIRSTPSSVTPSQSRLPRFNGTPYTPHAPLPLRSATTERQSRRLSRDKNSMYRSTMTPREILKVKQRSQKVDLSNNMHSNPKVAIVTPLKESTWINIQTEHSKETPIPYKGEAVVPVRPPRHKDFKTPNVSSSQSYFAQNKTPDNFHPKIAFSEAMTPVINNTPKLPPRSVPHKPIGAVTPIRMQHR